MADEYSPVADGIWLGELRHYLDSAARRVHSDAFTRSVMAESTDFRHKLNENKGQAEEIRRRYPGNAPVAEYADAIVARCDEIERVLTEYGADRIQNLVDLLTH